MSFAKEVWARLSAVDVSKHIETKGGLRYLSWAWAWGTLMEHYPESDYLFLEEHRFPDDTVEVRCRVTVREGEQHIYRDMWLPVMDHRNLAIQAPNARQVSDTRMRCMVKAMAMLGLGHYIYAGEDLPGGKSQDELRLEAHLEARDRHAESIAAYQLAVAAGDYSTAYETWSEIPYDDAVAIYGMAPTKLEKLGHQICLSTVERAFMKSDQWAAERRLHSGEAA